VPSAPARDLAGPSARTSRVGWAASRCLALASIGGSSRHTRVPSGRRRGRADRRRCPGCVSERRCTPDANRSPRMVSPAKMLIGKNLNRHRPRTEGQECCSETPRHRHNLLLGVGTQQVSPHFLLSGPPMLPQSTTPEELAPRPARHPLLGCGS
jgi:hypothetical protein